MREWNHSLYEHLYYTLKIKKMSRICVVTLTEFWKLNVTWNISPETAELRINLDDFERDKTDAYLWWARLLNVKEKEMTICYIMSRCLVMFLRGGKVNVVHYWRNIVAKLKVNKWSLSKWFRNSKPKNINFVPGQLFCRQRKAKFLLETDSLYWWSR